MPASWKGQFVLTEDARHDIEIDRYGVAGGTEYYWGPWSGAVGFVLGKVQHPNYGWLKRSKAQVQRQEADYCEIRIGYAGVPPATNQKTYQTSGSTSSEPIETHPDFATWGTPANGAKFDAEGKFTGFTDKTKSKYGVKSYLSGNLQFSETRVVGTISGNNDLSNLGKIDTPPASDVKPSTGAGRTWLLISGTAEQVGETGGKISSVWRLSALRGWDIDIYKD